MRGKDAETIRDLVEMLREYRDTAAYNRKLADNILAELDAAKARIADLEARPDPPSVEDVAYALAVYLNTQIGAQDMLCSIFNVGWDEANKAWREANERYTEECES